MQGSRTQVAGHPLALATKQSSGILFDATLYSRQSFGFLSVQYVSSTGRHSSRVLDQDSEAELWADPYPIIPKSTSNNYFMNNFQVTSCAWA
jgi:hypothetical protein